MAKYTLLKQEGTARRGQFETVHGTVQTPAFMNVATSAAIKGGLSTDDLKNIVVNEGDGLYKDEYEDGKYTYKGADPNNYITFNNEIWRIISIGADNTIKIMQNESIGNQV